ncbi:hypothetical protein APHAL10511_005719 [Amanita phalloides]|nr:hypothetical protein APHAL10511_005719 [Amanita phalloides]
MAQDSATMANGEPQVQDKPTSLRRAGLLQPMSPTGDVILQSHSQISIRLSSIRLSNIPPLPLRSPSSSPSSERTVILPLPLPLPSSTMSAAGLHLTPDLHPTVDLQPTASLQPTSNLQPTANLNSTTDLAEWEHLAAEELLPPRMLSGLSLLRQQREQSATAAATHRSEDAVQRSQTASPAASLNSHQRANEDDHDSESDDYASSERSTALTTPTLAPTPAIGFHSKSGSEDGPSDCDSETDAEAGTQYVGPDALTGQPSLSRRDTPTAHLSSERSPLLNKASSAQRIAYNASPSPVQPSDEHYAAATGMCDCMKRLKDKIKNTLSLYSPRDMRMMALRAIPAVMLGCLLNILDGVSYGMIIFPSTGVFSGLGPMGVSMFFASCIVSQLVYTLGGSGFACANGSMMIEVVPFFHMMANSIATKIGEDHPREIIATTLVAYALSSILTGLSFLLLGALKLGAIVGFFPRHILVGCIGGVGVFLIMTGLTVSLGMPDGSFQEDPLNSLHHMFENAHMITLWAFPLVLAIILRLITHRWHHQLVFPLYFIVIPVLFYVVVAVTGLSLDDLREQGWLFDLGQNGAHEAWYKMYSYLDFNAVQLGPIWATMPTQFALLFFNILHPPLNVPALSVSLNEDIDTNKELIGHGYSNLFAGLVGTVPNYLVYINTLLFSRVGGNSRLAGLMLALATTVLLFIGTGPIAYIPVLVVGALILVLGIDLVKEALWDTRHRVSQTEYLTIVCIMVCMTVWDFVIGVLFGIVVCCVFFVVQSSRRRSIRTIQTGETAMSSVRRPSLQREYIRQVSKQTTIIKLQGFLFFGTIANVEETIRALIDAPSWKHNPIRFLLLDLTLVAGVDMSSAEAFVRIQRLLYNKAIALVFCGFQATSPVGTALSCVGVLGAPGVELFSMLNDAMEWTENEYLHAWYRSQKAETTSIACKIPKIRESNVVGTCGSMARSPRQLQLRDAATRTLASESRVLREYDEEPFIALRKIFSTFNEISFAEFYPLKAYLDRLALPLGHVLWRQGDVSDGLYIVESGVLRATYAFAEHTQNIEESMFAGTLAGELSALSDLPRNATAVVERPAVLWKLSSENLRRLRMEQSDLATVFTHLVLKSAKIDYDTLLGALASRQ